MKRMLFCFCAVVALSAGAPSPATAQGYVGASVLSDVVRASGSEGNDANTSALGGALRVGATLGESWGVDLEFARAAETSWEQDSRIYSNALAERITGSFIGPDGLGSIRVINDQRDALGIYPASSETTVQRSTLTAMLWKRQAIGDRFSLVYLGGVAFRRTRNEFAYTVPIFIASTIRQERYRDEFVQFGTGVSIGLDAPVTMTEHLRLVPGIRMLAGDAEWQLRPSVGLVWQF